LESCFHVPVSALPFHSVHGVFLVVTFFSFCLVEQYGIDYNEAARQHTQDRTRLRRLLKGNIALVLVLEELAQPLDPQGRLRRGKKVSLSLFFSSLPSFEDFPFSFLSDVPASASQRRVCVANTHIFWDPEYADVKLWQTWILLQELEKLVLPRNLPLVLCGDFNSMLDSSVYELLSAERSPSGFLAIYLCTLPSPSVRQSFPLAVC